MEENRSYSSFRTSCLVSEFKTQLKEWGLAQPIGALATSDMIASFAANFNDDTATVARNTNFRLELKFKNASDNGYVGIMCYSTNAMYYVTYTNGTWAMYKLATTTL